MVYGIVQNSEYFFRNDTQLSVSCFLSWPRYNFLLISVSLSLSTLSFLSSISRIASREYEPTTDDVLRARIRTLGVQEYTIPFETPSKLPISLGRLIFLGMGMCPLIMPHASGSDRRYCVVKSKLQKTDVCFPLR